MIVVAANDSFRFIRLFDTRFLTMAEVAEVEDGVVIIDCVAIFVKRAMEANIIARRISLDVGFRE